MRWAINGGTKTLLQVDVRLREDVQHVNLARSLRTLARIEDRERRSEGPFIGDGPALEETPMNFGSVEGQGKLRSSPLRQTEPSF